MNIMKVLFLIHSLSPGGAERATVNLSNYWATKNWDVVIVTLAPLSKDFYKLHDRVRRIALNLAEESPNILYGAIANLKRLIAIRRVLNTECPDVAVGMMTTASVLLGFLSLTMSEKIVMIGCEQTHPPMVPISRLWYTLRYLAYPHLDAVIALTKESAQWIASKTGARRVEVIPNPIPWPFPSQPPYLNPKDILSQDCRLLLGVGRLVKEKGFDLLIGAFSKLASYFPEWVLTILGEGPLRHQLENQVMVHGLQGRIMLPGVAGNVGEWYERADIYVMSSRFEGFGNTLAEAMAHGTPVVSFDCPTGPRDIIRHEVDGLLVPPGDVERLVYALERLMRDESLRLRLAAKAVEARERFSLERIAAKWENLFAELKNLTHSKEIEQKT